VTTVSGPSMITGAGPAPLAPLASSARWPFPFALAAVSASAVTMNWRRASCSATRIWRACTLQAIATTTPASPAAPSPSTPATAG